MPIDLKGKTILIRVRTEFGILRVKDLDDTSAQTSHVVGDLRREHPALFQNEQSVALFLNQKCEQKDEVSSDKLLVEYGVTHGTMLYSQTTWQCAVCTLTNRGKKTQDSLCEACGEAPFFDKTPKKDVDNNPVVESAARKRGLPGNAGDNQDGNKKPRRRTSHRGRYIWGGPNSGETIDHFLESTRPTQVSTSECTWIQVHNHVVDSPGYEDRSSSVHVGVSTDQMPYRAALTRVEDTIARTNCVTASEKAACVAALLKAAVSRGETTGKWMLFVNREKVDDAWEKIARATVAGQLGSGAKVAPSKTLGDSRALICVYVKNFSDKKEVKRVLKGIIALDFLSNLDSSPTFIQVSKSMEATSGVSNLQSTAQKTYSIIGTFKLLSREKFYDVAECVLYGHSNNGI